MFVADPLEGEDEVELAGVAGVFKAGCEVGEVEVAEGVEAVVDGDDDDVAAAGEAGSVVELGVDGAVGVRAAVDVDHDWSFLFV